MLIDVLDGDPLWERWSEERLTEAALGGRSVIDPVILAEVHGRARDPALLARAFDAYRIDVVDLPPTTSKRAGAAFRAYREQGGARSGVMLSDFLIGAHAAMLGAPLLTRDRARFARYFPDLTLIAPESPTP